MSLERILGRGGRARVLQVLSAGMLSGCAQWKRDAQRSTQGTEHYCTDLGADALPENVRSAGVRGVHVSLAVNPRASANVGYSCDFETTTRSADKLSQQVRDSLQPVVARTANQVLAAAVAQRLEEALRLKVGQRLTVPLQVAVANQQMIRMTGCLNAPR